MTSPDLTDIIIRLLTPDDEMPYKLLLLADPSRFVIDKYIHTSDVYIACHKGNTIAVYVLCRISRDCIEIKNIAVDEEFQRRGLGKHLLNDVFARAKDKGFKKIVIGTANSSIAQLCLYQQQGFEITGIRKDFFIKNYSDPIYENGILAKHMVILTKTL